MFWWLWWLWSLCLGRPQAAPSIGAAASCVGSTLTGTVTTGGMSVGTVVTVRANAQTTGWSLVGSAKTFTVVAGVTSYPVTFNVAGIPGVKAFRVTATGAGQSDTSAHLKASACGPPAQVPEVPAPVLIPASMLLTAGLFELARRRRPALARV